MIKNQRFILWPDRPEIRDYARQFIDQVPTDKPWEVVVRPYTKSKSQEQLGYLFGVVLPAICKHIEESGGDHYTPDDVYQWMIDEYAESHVVNIKGRSKIVKRSASKMKTNDMSQFIECIIQHAAEYLRLPIPPADPYYNDQGREEASKRGS